MSRDDTIALVRRYLDAVNATDSDGMLACLTEDVAHDINQGEREIGKEKFRWFNARMSRHYDEELGDIAIMVNEGGNRAAAEFTVRGTYLSTDEGLPEA
ncbi:MAG: nuclear transport factor 2 family protein, partial [Parvibaculum sp.]